MAKKVAYVERDPSGTSYNGGWWSEHCQDVANGLKRLGFEVRGFDKYNLHRANIDRATPVRGSIRSTRRALDLLGVPQPKNVDIPESLMKHTHRKIWVTTLGELRAAREQVFVKSFETQKAWCGRRLYENYNTYYPNEIRENYQIKGYPDNYKVLASEVVNFSTEHRFYVINKKICRDAMANSYDAAPAHVRKLAWEMVKDYVDSPIGYAIDIAAFTKGLETKWALVEVNEGFSAGNDGCASATDYARMNAARWYEMVGMKRKMMEVLRS